MHRVRHRYLCPLRWADLDLLGHVNNVTYLDYLQEARGALVHDCLTAAGVERGPDDGLVVVRHEVTYRSSLRFGTEPVAVDTWVSELRSATFTLEHEILHERPDGTREVYLRARTVLAAFHPSTGRPRRITPAERQALAPYAEEGGPRSTAVVVDVPREHAAHYPIAVRFSDIDVFRHVNNVQYFEFFQEARIAVFGQLKDALRPFPRLHVVVAQADVEYVAPMVLRPEPYDCWSVITRIGTKSLTIESEIVDSTGAAPGGNVLARSRVVLVFFDLATNRSVEPPPGYREAMVRSLGGPLADPVTNRPGGS